jgi:cytochrome c553
MRRRGWPKGEERRSCKEARGFFLNKGVKKLLKISAYGLAALAVLLAVLAGVVVVASNAKINKNYAVPVRPVRIPSDAVAISRGQHIAQTRGCMDCHGKDFAGAKVMADGAMGRLYGPNITMGGGGQVAMFTAVDWVRAIRHGVGPDGRGLFIMPSEEYAKLSDEDLGALVAFLKTVPPVTRSRPPTELGPVTRVLLTVGKIKLAAETIDHTQLHPSSVVPGVTVEYGRYVAAGCVGCHGANYSGGKIVVGPPSWPEASNLTPQVDGRLAKWSEADFVNVMRTAKRPDGTELNPVMPRTFGQMDDVELKALYVFFKSLPPAAKGVR